MPGARSVLRLTRRALAYALYLVAVIVLLDVVLLKRILNLGYPSHYRQENIERYPAPYVEFTGKPDAADHNDLGFRGKSLRLAPSHAIRIAFFGGSTGYVGSPTIAEVIESELEKHTHADVFVANYSVVSSNHRQHLHSIVEYLPEVAPDLVLFYGGFNETIQTALYDPRPGYPYNFFFRSELSPFLTLLLENSALCGQYDLAFGSISGLKRLRSRERPLSRKWNAKIVEKYFGTLVLASEITSTIRSARFGDAKFFAFYQPFQVPVEFARTHALIRERIAKTTFAFDVSDVYLPLGDQIYTDIVHVEQPGNDLMGRTIARLVFEAAFQDADGR
jgi:hypothetical protein